MKKIVLIAIALSLYGAAYADWLQPGYLKFGIPAAWDKPLTTKTSYDLAQGVKDTATCATLETIPDWAKPTNWRIGRRKSEPKTCRQRLREKQAD